LLDDKFLEAYEHGILIVCADGVTRRVFPRFFTYSADYQEKLVFSYDVLAQLLMLEPRVCLSNIKFMGRCPCPRCHIERSQIAQLGTKLDTKRRDNARIDSHSRRNDIEKAREYIYKKGYAVESDYVEAVLGATSQVPTRVSTVHSICRRDSYLD
jgi:hypothetical protein